MSKKTILIVDDEQAIRDMIHVALDLADFNVLQAAEAQTAHSMIIDLKPDLVLLDWMMPGTSGLELARRLRKDDMTQNLPIIMLTAKGQEDNKVQGLDSGADDFVTKPFAPRELISRINAILRRTGGQHNQGILSIDKITLDPNSHRVSIGDTDITMGPTEFRLLLFFMTHQERVYTRSQLLDHVWGGNVYVEERTVDVHIRRLRKALMLEEQDRFIQTVRGAGYRFSHKDSSKPNTD